MEFFTAPMTDGHGDPDMTQPVIGFLADQPAEVVLTDAACAALNAQPGTVFPLRSLRVIDGGILLAEYVDGDNAVTRDLLPPGSVVCARQVVPRAPAPQQPAAG